MITSNGKEMQKIRSFLYLDNYKMYSISSQIFEGLTEYIVTNKGEENQETETQKGPVGSGRILGDIIQKSSNQTEKKFLHDYSYNLFEQALIERGKVIEVDKSNIDIQIDKLNEFSFIKVKGRAVFNDLKIIEEMLKNFNDFGHALGYITKKAAYDEQLAELNEQVKQIPDRNQKAKAKDLLKNTTEFKKILKEEGLQLDDDFLKHMAYLLNYGYNQQFEIQIPLDDLCLFSAQLDRNNLKDEEHRIIKKYSRETEKEFVLFGILTQIKKESEKDSLLKDKTKDWNEDEAAANMKEAIMNVVSTITGVEKTFTGKLDYEFIIDPISMYIDL
ncbi:hypothetical protein MASR2M47_32580 [Draconibacterium sp.]|jgi:hypothetical protein